MVYRSNRVNQEVPFTGIKAIDFKTLPLWPLRHWPPVDPDFKPVRIYLAIWEGSQARNQENERNRHKSSFRDVSQPNNKLGASADMRRMFELLLTFKPMVDPTDEQLVEFLCALGNCGLKPPSQTDPQWKEWVFRRSALRGLSVVSTHTDGIDRLKKFRRPVLIVTGTNTVSFHRRIDDILATQFPNVQRLELAGGHGAVATAPQQFVTGLLQFLNRQR